MFKKLLLIGVLASSYLIGTAAADTYMATSKVKGDTCSVTATTTSFTDASGKTVSGILFTASHPDNHRIDIFGPTFVIEFGAGVNSAFMPNLTVTDISNFKMHVHSVSAKLGREVGLKSDTSFTKSN